jgi:hypothetical protein
VPTALQKPQKLDRFKDNKHFSKFLFVVSDEEVANWYLALK